MTKSTVIVPGGTAIRIGIAYDLKADYQDSSGSTGPDDLLEEYDSSQTIDAIADALAAFGHVPVRLGGGRAFLDRMLAEPVDLVFNMAEGWGTRSREAQVPAICELLHVPYTHSDSLALAISLDKAMTKRIASANGIRTPEFICVGDLEELDAVVLPPFPLMVKLAGEGSSMGIRNRSRCVSTRQLREVAGELLREYSGPVMIERFLPGVEVTVLVMGNGAGERVVGIMEIAPRLESAGEFIYSLEVKRNYRSRVDYHVPPRLPAATIASIAETALGTYRALACRDIARVDIRIDSDGAASLIEVNPLPGLHPVDGDVPILCRHLGIPYTTLIGEIVAHAEARL